MDSAMKFDMNIIYMSDFNFLDVRKELKEMGK